ncbi:MAG TPA: hypothetical protein VEK38_00495 [Candidatus Bathyarchaeia archaeon]|nr:hypothetical protein [Candidatus Bathyarchaeia archaeon]
MQKSLALSLLLSCTVFFVSTAEESLSADVPPCIEATPAEVTQDITAIAGSVESVATAVVDIGKTSDTPASTPPAQGPSADTSETIYQEIDKKIGKIEKLYTNFVKRCIVFAAHRTGDLTAIQSLINFCRNYKSIVRSIVNEEQQHLLQSNETAYKRLLNFAEKLIEQINSSKADTAAKEAYLTKINSLLAELAQSQSELPGVVKKTVEIISSDTFAL